MERKLSVLEQRLSAARSRLVPGVRPCRDSQPAEYREEQSTGMVGEKAMSVEVQVTRGECLRHLASSQGEGRQTGYPVRVTLPSQVIMFVYLLECKPENISTDLWGNSPFKLIIVHGRNKSSQKTTLLKPPR
ncbi:hypothetical protein BTVI_113934 [Pitangus sulphuratus]|nr:hypothetical protein BTVI_113934 [Pitangus sulphuratus]